MLNIILNKIKSQTMLYYFVVKCLAKLSFLFYMFSFRNIQICCLKTPNDFPLLSVFLISYLATCFPMVKRKADFHMCGFSTVILYPESVSTSKVCGACSVDNSTEKIRHCLATINVPTGFKQLPLHFLSIDTFVHQNTT